MSSDEVRQEVGAASEDAEIEQFQILNREYAKRNLQLVKFGAAMRPLLFFFIGLGFVIIVAVGVPIAVRGEITAGDFTAFILYLQRMIWYLIALGYPADPTDLERPPQAGGRKPLEEVVHRERW